MNKLIISNQAKSIGNSVNELTIPYSQVTQILPVLRSEYFVECTIILPLIQNIVDLKFLMNISRIRTKNAKIIIGGDSNNFEKVSSVMKKLGYIILEKTDKLITWGDKSLGNDRVEQKKLKKVFGYHNFEKTGDEQIDEDDLLKNQNINLNKQKKIQSCADKPRACANCSCGRKQAEGAPLSKEELVDSVNKGKPVSGCGKCFLGDSFRCATCPYNGMPAFKPGDKLKLVQNSTVIVESAETSQTKVNNGKVKIQI